MSLPSFSSPEDFLQKFNDYLSYCRQEKRFVNIAGFCVFADITRETYYEYKNNKTIYSDTIRKIENIIETEVFESKLSPPERIFYLKNKFGYADKQEVVSHNVNVTADITPEDDAFLEELRQKYLGTNPST